MLRIIVLFMFMVGFCFESFQAGAQLLEKSTEFKKAIEKGTRTVNGLPGKKYWINHADYDLKVTVEFTNDTIWIIGSGEITYYNASPDSLKEIVLRSYPDFFAKGATRDYNIGSENEVEPVEYSNVLINGDILLADVINQRKIKTIGPGEKAIIKITWKYRLNPKMNLRQGIYSDKAIFVAYWYPQVAVYDDLFGWDKIEYTGLTEFYNDFNNYKVKITLPADYFVWGGGVLQNPDEVYDPNILEKYKAALDGTDLVSVLSVEDLLNNTSSDIGKTWYFKSEHSPDFTFAASRTHIWDAQSIRTGDGKKVLVSSVYAPQNSIYIQNTKWACEAIEYLSNICPGAPFPFSRMTVFNNQDKEEGAMESPMMVNTGDQQTADMAREVTFHEVAHTYLPFMLGTNERIFAWMDEGWATYQGIKWSNGRKGTTIDMFRELFYQIDSNSLASPLMIPSYHISGYNAETYHAYVRSSQALMALESQLGVKKMNEGWTYLAEQWSGKHVSPWDFFAIFNKSAGENINWLIEPWFYENAYPDLAIESVDTIKGSISIKNMGGLPMPVFLNVKYNDSTTMAIYRKPEVFKMENQCTIQLKRVNGIRYITLGNQLFFDKNTSNNRWLNEFVK
jgi:hypothetical protein